MPNVFNVQKAVKQLIWTGMMDDILLPITTRSFK